MEEYTHLTGLAGHMLAQPWRRSFFLAPESLSLRRLTAQYRTRHSWQHSEMAASCRAYQSVLDSHTSGVKRARMRPIHLLSLLVFTAESGQSQ